MNIKESNKGTPMSIWVGAFGIALLLMVVLYFFMNIRDKQIEIKNPIGNLYFEHYTNKQENRLDLYFLGSSLTQDALIAYFSFDSIIAKRNRRINYKTVVRSGARLQDFNNIIMEIKKLRPRCLFIESNLACISMDGSNNIFYFFIDYRTRLARFPESLFGMGSNVFQLINNPVPKAYFVEKKLKLDFDTNKTGYYDSLGEMFRVRSLNEFRLWSMFYKEAAGLGIKIYLLELPRSIEAERHLLVKFKEEYKDLVRQYKTVYNIDYIGFSNKISQDKYYLDRAHFNKLGGDYYCEWLMNELCNRNLINCN